MHKLLQRQLERHFGELGAPTDEWHALLSDVDEAYSQSDLDRGMLERSLDLSSQELMQANAALRKSNDELERRVRERTVDLTNANLLLKTQIGERRRAEEELRKSLVKLAAMHTMGQAVLVRIETKEIIRVAVERARRLLQASTSLLVIKGANGSFYYADADGSGAEFFLERQLQPGGLQERVIRSEQPLLTNDPVAEGWADRSSAERLHLRALVAVPININGQVVGCLTALRMNDAPPFSHDEFIILSTFVDYVSFALRQSKFYEQLKDQAERDSLTALYNRRVLTEHLRREILRSERMGRSAGVLMLDIDNFKSINDTYGHLAGDAALRELAQRLEHAVRGSDVVGRYGGEEFLIILAQTDRDEAHRTAQRVLGEVTDDPYLLGKSLRQIRISVGVAAFPQDATDGLSLIAAADSACYEAKRRGGAQVVLFSETRDFHLPILATPGGNGSARVK